MAASSIMDEGHSQGFGEKAIQSGRIFAKSAIGRQAVILNFSHIMQWKSSLRKRRRKSIGCEEDLLHAFFLDVCDITRYGSNRSPAVNMPTLAHRNLESSPDEHQYGNDQ